MWTPEGQCSKLKFLVITTKTGTFCQNQNQTIDCFALTEVMAKDVLDAYIVEDREEEIK